MRIELKRLLIKLQPNNFLIFLPETERLFLASPNIRRNFIDQLIFTYNIKYNKILNLYNKYILERSNC